ncbi:hypothetical protein ACJX0J_023364, partial [Zea mays]
MRSINWYLHAILGGISEYSILYLNHVILYSICHMEKIIPVWSLLKNYGQRPMFEIILMEARISDKVVWSLLSNYIGNLKRMIFVAVIQNPEYMGFWQQITLISMRASAGTERQDKNFICDIQGSLY